VPVLLSNYSSCRGAFPAPEVLTEGGLTLAVSSVVGVRVYRVSVVLFWLSICGWFFGLELGLSALV
jgi:hypothetical protein